MKTTEDTKKDMKNHNVEFIKKARKVHGDKYVYDKVEYINSKTKFIIICPIHGEFEQTPSNHLSGSGCPKCGLSSRIKKQTMLREEFIKNALKVHGNKYGYEKVVYEGAHRKIVIGCTMHRDFEQTPNNHLKRRGCPKCGGTKKSNTEEFIKKANEIHGDRYGYEKVEYINSKTKVIIICPIHGEFEQTPTSHLSGQGCPGCGANKKKCKVKHQPLYREWLC